MFSLFRLKLYILFGEKNVQLNILLYSSHYQRIGQCAIKIPVLAYFARTEEYLIVIIYFRKLSRRRKVYQVPNLYYPPDVTRTLRVEVVDDGANGNFTNRLR